MCIVLDTNCFSKVFNTADAEHHEFRPVLDWIIGGDGCLVYGGSKYKKELANAKRYLGLFAELKRLRKIRNADDVAIDARQKEIEKLFDPAKHNDPHLPAIICACRCLLICTKDAKSVALLKDKRCYSKGVKVPKLYMSKKNSTLLCARNIADCCKPVTMLNKDARSRLAVMMT